MPVLRGEHTRTGRRRGGRSDPTHHAGTGRTARAADNSPVTCGWSACPGMEREAWVPTAPEAIRMACLWLFASVGPRHALDPSEEPPAQGFVFDYSWKTVRVP